MAKLLLWNILKVLQRLCEACNIQEKAKGGGRGGTRAAGYAREGGPCIRTQTVILCVY